MSAQTVVNGKYKGHRVTIRYYADSKNDYIEKFDYDGEDIDKKINELNEKIKTLNEKIKTQSSTTSDKEINQLKKDYKKCKEELDSCRTKKTESLEDKLARIQKQSLLDSLQNNISRLNKLVDSLQQIVVSGNNDNCDETIVSLKNTINEKVEVINNLKDDLTKQEKVNKQLVAQNEDKKKKISTLNSKVQQLEQHITELMENRTPSENHSHIGLYYRIGLPILINGLLKQNDADGQSIWHKSMRVSHNIGFQWSSASLSKKTPILLGVGIEYSRIHLSAGIGDLSETIHDAIDADQCNYTAYLRYQNITEDVALSYISLPLTLTLGQPYTNRISGYGHFTIAPAFCVAKKLHAYGSYNLSGYYSEIDGNEVDLLLDDYIPQLGFGQNLSNSQIEKNSTINTFVLFGRISGGMYIPLCNLKKGKTSPCLLKMGLNLDFSITPIAKKADINTSLPDAHYNLNEYNILSGSNSRIINPSFEIGLVYIIKSKENGK